MDKFLVEYIRSGNAWVLVGAGPSIEMGYPRWEELATEAVELVRREGPAGAHNQPATSLEGAKFPLVFEQVASVVGMPRLLAHLRGRFVPRRPGRVYSLIARWPVSVYLTTNFDYAIPTALTEVGETYRPYSNSPDHIGLLGPQLTGAVFQLHGNLDSEDGLILTQSQYRAIQSAPEWTYWRTKLTSVFQMVPLVVLGYSLSDPNIKHVLEAATKGAAVDQPICWVAPDVDMQTTRGFLEKYRIRVISYDNRDGTHRNLATLLANVSQFVFPRTTVRLHRTIKSAISSPLGTSAAAPGFFVFTKLVASENFDAIRVGTVCSALQSIIPELRKLGSFTLAQALALLGWPTGVSPTLHFQEQIVDAGVEQGLLVRQGGTLSVGPTGDSLSQEANRFYQHSRGRFLDSLVLRIRRNYPTLDRDEATGLAQDIESSLAGFFRAAGLSLSTTLLATGQRPPVPPSIIRFLNEASAQYPDLLRRQAFSTVSVDIFTQPEDADREYLGRVSQGFFAFHALGMFGDAAAERLSQASDTVWLVDSSLQIPSLALAAPTQSVFRDTFTRLHSMGIRLFTTQKLFNETCEHFWFAQKVIRDYGQSSEMVIAAALGQAPFRKSNQFLEGFVGWRATGNPNDWESYVTEAIGHRAPSDRDLFDSLRNVGVEVVSLDNWPGFSPPQRLDAQRYVDKIVEMWQTWQNASDEEDAELIADYYEKADPEGEALFVVFQEREGRYHMLSNPNAPSPAWFISQTSMLNLVDTTQPVTWKPEAFLRFASTLAPSTDNAAAERAFQILLLAFTQVGVSLLDQRTLTAAFGGIIDEAAISLEAIKDVYHETLAKKYGETPKAVIERLPPAFRPLAALQLANEIASVQADKVHWADQTTTAALARATKAETEVGRLQHIKERIKEKQRERQRLARQRREGRARGRRRRK